MNEYIEEIVKEFSQKITDHAFDGSCCYNSNEGGKGHLECRYPYNPGREHPSGPQCLKLKEEHFDIRAALQDFANKRDEELREKVNALQFHTTLESPVLIEAAKVGWSRHAVAVLSLLSQPTTTSNPEKK